MPTIAHLPGIEKLSQSDLAEMYKTAQWIGINPDWLAAVIKFESKFDPKAVNAASGATGIIQWLPSTAKNLGTTTTALKGMSFKQQLVYVKKYFAPMRGKLKSLEDTYLTVFYPAAIGRPLDFIVGESGSKVYEQNKGFDKAAKGYITKSDITSTIRNVMASAKDKRLVVALGVTGLGSLGLMAVAFGLWKLTSTPKSKKVS